MKWLIRRMLGMWLILAAICAGTVVIARLNPAPSRLQVLGFTVCDGEPCYRGIKPGMAWDRAKALYPDGLVEHERMISFAGEQSPFRMINFQRSEEQTVRRIEFVRRSPQLIPASLGEVVALLESLATWNLATAGSGMPRSSGHKCTTQPFIHR